MKKVSIVGFGRFGKVLYRLLCDDFDITVYDARRIKKSEVRKGVHIARTLREVYPKGEERTIFYCVPISAFETVVQKHARYITKEHVLIDTLSVKMHPREVFSHIFRDGVETMLTHPMFGPDSARNGFAGLPIVLDRHASSPKTYAFWKGYFKRKGLRVVELSARDHDKMAARSQGVAHFVGRLLDEFGLETTVIDTVGARKLKEVVEQTCNDTWQLFRDLQTYNPYTRDVRLKIGRAYDKIYGKLLPDRLDPRKIIFGIQGGKGSFNEAAVTQYAKDEGIERYEVRYLYTTERVLRELHKGTIDYGQFAMHNSIGGVVEESARAMARYKFAIVKEFAVKVRHFLMKLPDVPQEKITTIMGHGQALLQCKATLAKKYPHLAKESGKGDLVDGARAAKTLSEGVLPRCTAILGPGILSSIYGLEIIGEDLQDMEENYTSFFMTKRM